MRAAAFAAWLLTALGGFVMFATWTSGGGTRAGGFSPALVLTHLGLAAAGLLAWVVHLVGGSTVTAWVAVAVLVPVVALGLTLLRAWLDGRPPGPRPERRPEQWIAPSVVVLHGAGAVLTVVLVVVATVVR